VNRLGDSGDGLIADHVVMTVIAGHLIGTALEVLTTTTTGGGTTKKRK
jgi:hypothetical protein